MGRGLVEEKLFSENVDRLISGQEVRDLPESGQDLKTALDFARLMHLRRPQPSPQFKSNLKARLLQKLAQQEAEVKIPWYQRLIPRQPVWQVASVLVAVLVISGVVLGLILRDGGRAPVVQAPTVTTTTTTIPATTTAAPTTTVTATTTASTTIPAVQVQLSAEATTDKTVYAPDEPVVIEVKLKNTGSRPVLLTQFPPILSLLSAAGDPVLSFHAGQTGRTLAAGETVNFFQIWYQEDAKGRTVSPGRYYLELEDIDLQGQAYKIKLSQPVTFEIVP